MARQKKPADAVQFTRESAERIAGVVRAAELTPAAGSPLTFDRRLAERVPKQVRAATFSGAWPTGSTKTVTFKYAPIATVNAVNLSWPITLGGYVNEDCIVGKEGTSWWLVVPRLEAQTASFVSQTVSGSYVSGISTTKSSVNYLSDISISASLNTSNCQITVTTSKSSATIDAITSVNATTATTIFVSSHYTASFLRIRNP